jgi:hypothetical protein
MAPASSIPPLKGSSRLESVEKSRDYQGDNRQYRPFPARRAYSVPKKPVAECAL